jgi:hypothetical protein
MSKRINTSGGPKYREKRKKKKKKRPKRARSKIPSRRERKHPPTPNTTVGTRSSILAPRYTYTGWGPRW